MKAPTERFSLKPFVNTRTTSQSWRVSGIKRDGQRIRENFTDLQEATNRRLALEAEYQQGHQEVNLKTTRLNDSQISFAEDAFKQLTAAKANDSEIVLAIDYYLREVRSKRATAESPLMEDAVKQFNTWVDSNLCGLRNATKGNLKLRVKIFAASLGNVRVSEIEKSTVALFLHNMQTREANPVSASSADNYRRGLQRFFSWCIGCEGKPDKKDRQWIAANPCNFEVEGMGKPTAPSILTNEQCELMLRAAEREGLAAYVATCLFAGLRPTECQRLVWSQISLKDRTIHLTAQQTKTHEERDVTICETLAAWLERYQGQSFFPKSFRGKFDRTKLAAGFSGSDDERYDADLMRHTSISHYFRQCGSFGLTAEQHGNSERIIRRHYKSKTTPEQTAAFYAIRPTPPEQPGEIITDVEFAQSKVA